MEYTLLSISFLIIFIVISLMVKMDKLESRLKAMQQTLEQLANQSDMPENPINDELRQLIKEGRGVQAVKKAREAFGFSLIEGKQYIDKLKSDGR